MIILLVAFLLPISIFIFLKTFGKNEFHVAPLYTDVEPPALLGCGPATMPYHIPDSVLTALNFGQDSLVIASVADSVQEKAPKARVLYECRDLPVRYVSMQNRPATWRACVFFLQEPFDLVLVDRKGTIRGQYDSKDLDEVDRLITEIAIILKNY